MKPTLKFDNAGIGYSEVNPENWWETLYDNAAKNIKVELHDGEASLTTIDDSNVLDGWNIVPSKNKKHQKYGNFLKTSTLHNGHLIQDTSTKEKEKTAKDSVYITLSDKDDDKTARYNPMLNRTLQKLVQHQIEQDRKLKLHIANMCEQNTNLVKENTMTHRKTNVQLDTEESDDPEESQEMIVNQNTSQHEIKDVFISRSLRKNRRKKLNKLTQQLKLCSLKKNTDLKYEELALNEESKFKKDKQYKLQLGIKSGKCNKKRKTNRQIRNFKEWQSHMLRQLKHEVISDTQDKPKDKIEDVYWQSSSQQKNIFPSLRSPVTSNSNNLNDKADKIIYNHMIHSSNKVTYNKETRQSNQTTIKPEMQEQKTTWEYFDAEKRDLPPYMEGLHLIYDEYYKLSNYKSLSTSLTKGQSHTHNLDDKLHNKDKKIKKKKQQKQVKKQLEKVISPVKFCTDDLNNVIKKLTTFDLTEGVNANKLKKKLTQTHRTPV